jgi:hypothetical protein
VFNGFDFIPAVRVLIFLTVKAALSTVVVGFQLIKQKNATDEM